MSATSSTGALCEPAGQFPSSSLFRFGHESSGAAGEWSVEWKLTRNCSYGTSRLLCFCFTLCGLSLGVASFLWWYGAASDAVRVGRGAGFEHGSLCIRATRPMASGSPCIVIA